MGNLAVDIIVIILYIFALSVFCYSLYTYKKWRDVVIDKKDNTELTQKGGFEFFNYEVEKNYKYALYSFLIGLGILTLGNIVKGFNK